jgi:hypothetical protein
MKSLLLTVCLLLAAFIMKAQNVAVVDFMKVPVNGQDAYLAAEKQWKLLHQNRVDAGKILNWELYSVRGSGTASPYNFATVTIFENFDKTEAPFTEADFKKAFGANTNEVLKKTTASRDLIYSEMYRLEVGIAPKTPDKYLVINSIHTDNPGKYFNMEKVGYMPMHEQAVKMGKRNSWGIWSRWPNADNNVQAVAVDGFTKYSDINSADYGALFEKAMEGKKAGEAMEIMDMVSHTDEIRSIIRSEIWDLVDSTTPKGM